MALAADEARVLLALEPAESDRVALRRLPSRARHFLGRVLGGPADRPDDVRVARAAADLAGDRHRGSPPRSGPGSRPAGRGRSASCPACRSRTAGRAPRRKPCWTGSSTPSCSRPSTVRDLVAVGHRGEHGARLDRLAVHQHDARAAVGGVAAPVGAGHAEGRRAGSGPAAGAARRPRCSSSPLTVIETCIHASPPVPVPPRGAARGASAPAPDGACTRPCRAGRP